MINNYIRIALLAFATLIAGSVSSQVSKTDYFMETSYLKTSLNPALRPDQGYLVIPFLPNVGVNAQTNKFNIDNLTFKGPTGQRVTFMHPSVNADEFLSNMAKDNYINTDVNVKLFGVGFYSGNNFWSIDLGLRTHTDVNVPKPFFGLLKKGFDQGKQTRYDLSDLSATGYSFAELGIAHSRMFINNTLTVGARVKLLGGIADFDLDAKSLTIDAGPDYWTARSQVVLRGSAPGVTPKYDEKGYIDGFDFDYDGVPGYGAGLDLGVVYDLKDVLPVLEGLKISAAINDIGSISWSKKNSLELRSQETDVTIRPNDYDVEDGSSLSDIFDNAFDDLKEAVNLRGENKSRSSSLRMNTVLGAEYEFFKHKLSLGALYSVRYGNYFNTSEFTVSANARPCPWVSTSFSYSFMHSKFDTFGFALHLAPTKGISLFLASDYAIPRVNSDFMPTTSKALNFQMGISIPLGLKKSRSKKVVDDVIEPIEMKAPRDVNDNSGSKEVTTEEDSVIIEG